MLDKLFTDMQAIYTESRVCAPVGRADHNVVLCQPTIDKGLDTGKTQSRVTRVVCPNEKAIALALRRVKGEKLYRLSSCEERFSMF